MTGKERILAALNGNRLLTGMKMIPGLIEYWNLR